MKMTRCIINLKELMENESKEGKISSRYSIFSKKRIIRINYTLKDGILHITKVSVYKLNRRRYRMKRWRPPRNNVKRTISTESQTELPTVKEMNKKHTTRKLHQKAKPDKTENDFLKEQIRIQSCIITQLTEALKCANEKNSKIEIDGENCSNSIVNRKESENKIYRKTFWKKLLFWKK